MSNPTRYAEGYKTPASIQRLLDVMLVEDSERFELAAELEELARDVREGRAGAREYARGLLRRE